MRNPSEIRQQMVITASRIAVQEPAALDQLCEIRRLLNAVTDSEWEEMEGLDGPLAGWTEAANHWNSTIVAALQYVAEGPDQRVRSLV